MSRMDELIRTHCPDGVMFKLLGQVAGYSETRVDANTLDEESFVGVDNLLSNQGGKVAASYKPNTARLTAYVKGDILLGNIRPYLKKIWLATNDGGCSGDVLAIRILEEYKPQLDPGFLYRLLSSEGFFAYDMQHAKGAKMPRGSKTAILKYRVPVPPIEVQREIVRILDTFSKLEAELEAELEARRKQYTFYRDQLLTFTERERERRIRWARMTEICLKTQTIRWPKVGDQQFAYIDLTSVDRQTHAIGETQAINASNAPSRAQQIVRTDDVLFGTTRPTLMRYCSIPELYDGQICSTGYCVLRPDREQVHPRWVFHLVSSSAFFRYVDENQKGAGYPAIADSAVMNWEVPVPPMHEQERIVEVLDKFEALVNDLSSGLPAEIKGRRQQYEHYRNRLLTFQEAG